MSTTPTPAGADLPQGALTDEIITREWLKAHNPHGEGSGTGNTRVKRFARAIAALAARPGATDKCEGCNGHGMVGGLRQDGYHSEECPFCKGSGATAAAGVPEKYDDTLLPFLALMRAELHANSRKGDRPGWLTMSREVGLLEIYWHTAKLSAAVKNNDMALIREHSADVANMAMMVLDVCGGIPENALAAQTETQPASEAAEAARYRWLRDKSEPGICAFYLSVGKAFDGVKFTQATVDEAIDAQIAAQPAPAPGAGKGDL